MSTPLRVYLAARFSRRDELREYAADLAALGIDVTSRWLTEEHPEIIEEPGGELSGSTEELAGIAYNNLADIRGADILVLFTEPVDRPPRRNGRMVELGYALGLSKTAIIVGPRENVFCWQTGVLAFEDFDVARQWLVQIGAALQESYRKWPAPITTLPQPGFDA